MSETTKSTGLSHEPPASARTISDSARDSSERHPEGGKHFVHVYTVVRVKVEVEADDHPSAMAVADTLLFGNGFGVSFVPRGAGVVEAEYAEEVVGYLVDEADDPEYERSRNYGPDHEPQEPDQRYRHAPAVASEDRSVTLTFLPRHGGTTIRSRSTRPDRRIGLYRCHCSSNGFRRRWTGIPRRRTGMICVTKMMLRNGSGTGLALSR